MIVGAFTLMALAALAAFAANVVAVGAVLRVKQGRSAGNLPRLAFNLVVVTVLLAFAGSAILVSQ